jgi:hypothetical protein
MIVNVQLHKLAALPSAKESPVTTLQNAGLASGSVWPQYRTDKYSIPAGKINKLRTSLP